MVKIMEKPIKMDDLGVFGNTHLSDFPNLEFGHNSESYKTSFSQWVWWPIFYLQNLHGSGFDVVFMFQYVSCWWGENMPKHKVHKLSLDPPFGVPNEW